MGLIKNFRRLIYISAALLMGSFLLVKLADAAAPDGWQTNFDAAQKISTEQQKPMLTMFSASWCPPCNYMKANIFPDPEVQKALGNYIALYIDVDEHGDLLTKYKVEAFPTFLVFEPDGSEVSRFDFTNSPDAKSFFDILNSTAEKLGKIKELNQSLEKNNFTDKDQLFQLAGIYEGLKKYQRSLDALKKIEALDPENTTKVKADIAFMELMLKQSSDDGVFSTPKEIFQAFSDIRAMDVSPTRAEEIDYILIGATIEDQTAFKKALETYLQTYPESRHKEEITQILTYLKNMEETHPESNK